MKDMRLSFYGYGFQYLEKWKYEKVMHPHLENLKIKNMMTSHKEQKINIGRVLRFLGHTFTWPFC